MILLTGLYSSGNEKRDAELRVCVEKNITNKHFDEIYLMMEGAEIPNKLDKCLSCWIANERVRAEIGDLNADDRMTFKAYFEWANELFAHGSLICLANSDIYFDETIALVKPAHLDNVFMCLSRWRENSPDEAARDGHDAWIFKTPVKIPPGSDFVLGSIAQDRVLGLACNDVCIAGLMEEVGYKIVNPGLDVKAYHVHESNFRNYAVDDRLLFKPKRRVLRSHLEAV